MPQTDATLELHLGNIETAAIAAHRAAAALLAFIPADVNPVVLTVDRITAVRDTSRDLVDVLGSLQPEQRTTNADVDRA